jgi:hypothetical protein
MVPRSGSAEDSLIGGVGDNFRCRQEYAVENCRSQEEAASALLHQETASCFARIRARAIVGCW